MFTCYYHMLDRFQEPVVCIGILGDSSKSWRPDTWEVDTLDCHLRFTYPVVKLQDFAARIEELQIVSLYRLCDGLTIAAGATIWGYVDAN